MRSSKKTKPKKDPSRLRLYSFAATILIVSLLIVGSYFQSQPRIAHIPSNFEFNMEEWMSFVPHDSEYVSFVDYQVARSVTHNSSLFGSSLLFELPQVNFAIFPEDIVYEVVIQPPEQKFSGSTTVLRLVQERSNAFVDDLALVNQTKIRAPFGYDGYMVYELLMRKLGDQKSNLGYISFANSHIVLSDDQKTGLQDVQYILDQIKTSTTNLFDDDVVQRGVYATGITDQSYAGLFVGKFSTQLNDTQMAVKSIAGSGNSILVSRSFLFPKADLAVQRLDQARYLYRGGATFSILDSWLVVEYDYPSSRLQAELTGI